MSGPLPLGTMYLLGVIGWRSLVVLFFWLFPGWYRQSNSLRRGSCPCLAPVIMKSPTAPHGCVLCTGPRQIGLSLCLLGSS